MISQSEYLKNRIDDQISWYEKKSRGNKNWYRRLRIVSIAIALSIPILTSLIGSEKIEEDTLKIIIAVAGATIGLIEGLMGLNKYHDLWSTYRMAAEKLKYHRYLFEAGAAPYDGEDSFQVFVKNAEDIMASERAGWQQSSKQAAPSASAPQPEVALPSSDESPGATAAELGPADGEDAG